MNTYDFIAQVLTTQVKTVDDQLSVITDNSGKFFIKQSDAVVLWFKARADWSKLPEHQLIFVEDVKYNKLLSVKLTLYKLFAWEESFYYKLITTLADYYHITEDEIECLLCSGTFKKDVRTWTMNELEGRFLKYEIEYVNGRKNTNTILGVTKDLRFIY